MSKFASVLLLLVAAYLEAGGDWMVRKGIHTFSWQRGAWFAIGAAVLFAYGWTVNRPPWNFGELLGLYVVFFFLIAQLISWLAFKQAPSLQMLLGGALIVAGG